MIHAYTIFCGKHIKQISNVNKFRIVSSCVTSLKYISNNYNLKTIMQLNPFEYPCERIRTATH